MSDNVVAPSDPRIGWLIDGNPGTPLIPATLEDTGREIHVLIPTGGMRDASHMRNWWSSVNVMIASHTDDPRAQSAPPRNMLFHDPAGTVALIGCRAVGHRANSAAGVGHISVRYAVIGGRNLKYDTINGFRAEMPALTGWTGLSSMNMTQDISPNTHLVTGATLRLSAPDPMRLSRAMNLTLMPSWRTADKGNIVSVHDVVQLATATKRARPWDEHLESLIAIQELIELAAWKPVGFSRLTANRGDDPIRVLSGKAVGEKWAKVATHRVARDGGSATKNRYLFTYADVGTPGIQRWLRIRQKFARAFQPLIAILDQRDSYVETRLLQSSIALDSLGYQLAVDAGNARPGKCYPHQDALRQVLDDMATVPIEEPTEWLERSNHNGVKHADNPSPHSLEAANTMRENILVARFWLGQRLGASGEELKGRLYPDPLGQPYEAII